MGKYPLKPLAENENRKLPPFVVIDLETVEWVKFLVGGIYDGREVIFFRSIKDGITQLFDKYSGLTVFAHYGGIFDFLFILDCVLGIPNISISPIIPRGSGILTFELKRGSDVLTFWDSSALLPFSLKTLTQNFGVTHKKQEIDYNFTEVTPKLLEYLEYDLKGLYECLKTFYNWPIIRTCGGAYTLASQAFRVLRTTLKGNIYPLSRNVDRNIRASYYGGRVEIFRPVYTGKNPLYCYDVQSLYPYVMRNFQYPNAFLYETYDFEPKKFGIYECTASVPKMHIPPLGVTVEDEAEEKFIFPTGTFKGVWTSAEIEYAKRLGCNFKIHHGHIFSSSGFLFKSFVDLLYPIKQNAKNDVDRTIAKLLLNSCYGRFGLSFEKENVVLDDGSIGLTPLREFKIGRRTLGLMTKKVEIDSFSNVAIASFVTSYARIHMHKFLHSLGDSVYYTDTDSLFTTTKFPTGDELGNLKEEYRCHDACFLLPKTYIAGKKIAMKGFDKKKIQHFTYDDFFECLQGDLKRLSIIQEPKFAKFKTAMKSGALVGMTKSSTRQIRSRYDKRILIQEGKMYTSKPIHLEVKNEHRNQGSKTTN